MRQLILWTHCGRIIFCQFNQPGTMFSRFFPIYIHSIWLTWATRENLHEIQKAKVEEVDTHAPPHITYTNIYGTYINIYTIYICIYLKCIYIYLIDYFFLVFCLFRTTLAAYGGSQGWTGATAASLHHSHSTWDPGESGTYTTAHGNTGSLTHWARPGTKPVSSWILVRSTYTEPWWNS